MLTKEKCFNFSHEGKVGYLLSLPKDYDQNTEERYPVILFLHGAGERGDDIEKVKKYGIHRYLDDLDIPFVVVSPQCADNNFWDSHLSQIESLFLKLNEEIRVDLNRICVVGISLGAYGAWNFAMQRPNLFKSLVSVAGGAMLPKYANRICHVPVYVTHGVHDDEVKLSESVEIADALMNAGGNVTLVIEDGYGHELCTKAFEKKELFDWIVSNT